MTPTLRIASYNLQKCVGLDMRRRPDRTLRVIDALKASVVVLQEADKRLPPRPAALPRDLLASHGWRILPFGQPKGSLGFHGNAILVRPEVTMVAREKIDLPGLEPRGAVRADLMTPIGPLRIVGVHLGLLRRYRLLQLQAVTRGLRDLPPMPTLLAGDFNEWGPVSALDTATPGLRFAKAAHSFPAPRPVAALDRFALGPGLEAAATGVFTGRPAPIASDHLPVWIDLAPATPPVADTDQKEAELQP
ncbi:endonuclease/exonuclease/phosphatase family protein [Shimia biformata]|uniref:endonuclease/exonuclease/phosphatase family protein n=1 Tax=Shimia biformata TaxID=1294299 RepID=UPI0019501E53|nr:endonuclease/exonuclease/phosphatase family protein [Shimia biformata]